MEGPSERKAGLVVELVGRLENAATLNTVTAVQAIGEIHVLVASGGVAPAARVAGGVRALAALLDVAQISDLTAMVLADPTARRIFSRQCLGLKMQRRPELR